MLTFNVHFTRVDGTADSKRIDAETPKDAVAGILANFPGAIIGKTKRWKAQAEAQQIGGDA
ncbi:hypothetical protein [Rhizobium rhizophilum]|uniref:Uncharacterized protein n=1 Tax=Rhizobium rhizophilum TaxID=1850373 RepID=A0ABY2QTG5_9HYPH|nr:hypothetical protein [Rhizobium rhizophilum]THV13754.1 hypothetical protein E9677_12665 [Rhizobium rhizophilum]